MKITFRIRYSTHPGQNIFVCGDHPLLGSRAPEKAIPMRYVNADYWESEVEFAHEANARGPFSYFYLVRNADRSVLEDFGGDRKLDLTALAMNTTVIWDSWNETGAVDNVYFTEPFQEVLLNREHGGAMREPPMRETYAFCVNAPLLPPDQTVCLHGSSSLLGNWDTAHPVLLHRNQDGQFSAHLNLPREAFPLSYKYGIYDVRARQFIRYEDGANRTLPERSPQDGIVIVHDGFARWPNIPWRGAGVSIPVFSLRSEKSFGVGEFLDLKPLADWAKRAGFKLIQILPVNDTSATKTWVDSYPYAAISAFALHPQYINLERVAGAGGRKLLKHLEPQREKLNALPAVDYEAVMNAKMAFLRNLFHAQQKETVASMAYQEFFAENKHWLVPYSAFCCLRDKYKTCDFHQWPQFQTFNAAAIDELRNGSSTAREEMGFYAFVQFHLHLQLREAAEYLHSRGVILKGDIAIGVHRHGADVWQHPDLFHVDMQAGAPPDAFAAKGQNWGFPTYNWPRMKQDGFAWWKQRFAQMSVYFDAFRIDHILGFFRIWSIPLDAVEGILGHFVPAIPVRVEEFEERGIVFDKKRFIRPYITEDILSELFADKSAFAQETFLNAEPNGQFSLKPEFSTQRKVEAYFAARPENPLDLKLRSGLYDLISNVLMVETAEGELHFRLGLEQTSSYKALNPQAQVRVKNFYIDSFYHRQDEFWRAEALQKIPALKRKTDMLICGEDLGMVPACVPEVMAKFGLLALEVQRMPKALGQDFSDPARASYLSVVTPSTHDMSTIRSWWKEDRAVTQIFFTRQLRQTGPAPAECEPWIIREIVRQHLESPAQWSIFQLQDLLATESSLAHPDPDSERINVPAIPNYYWRYRMHVPLEKLGLEEDFCQRLRMMVHESGRA